MTNQNSLLMPTLCVGYLFRYRRGANYESVSSIRRTNYRVLKLKAEIDHFLYVTGASAKQLSMAVFHSPGVVYDILADRRIPQHRTRRRLENFMLKADGSIDRRHLRSAYLDGMRRAGQSGAE